MTSKHNQIDATALGENCKSIGSLIWIIPFIVFAVIALDHQVQIAQ